MLREIREYADLGVELLLTLKTNLVQLPRKTLISSQRLFAWASGFFVDYDIGKAIFHAWCLLMVYLTAGVIQTYTNIFEGL
uniref:Uncharacterized protein n=1 Tax=Caenorhabditis japonica TaxID=281687 RepID=A0A8R1HP47_CAEJA